MSLLCRAFLFCITLFVSVFFSQTISSAEPGRWEQELSGPCWHLWLDRETDWTNDSLYLPPVDVRTLTVKPPGCGWENLERMCMKQVAVPGTVEEYFWGVSGNPNGTAGDYRGVSWWSRTFRIDSSLRGKRIVLAFESVNLRAEVFVNRRLVGYDVIGNTPFEFPITDAVNFEGDNRLDVRITDPVGTFDWNDENLLRWGNNWVPSVHGFGGVTGRIFIRATDAVHIDDIYVQNKPEITNADVFVTVGEKDGDRRFYLNGERVFILAAMTRGFWPKNGIFPTPEMAVCDMEQCLDFGHNMMLYHRAIGQPLSIETADEMGVLAYEEPGGYLCRPGPTDFAKEWRREKLRRMIIRDRSHPSMVIFNIDDLSYHASNEDDERNIRMVHSLDPSRTVTYNCITRPTIPNEPDNPFKLQRCERDNARRVRAVRTAQGYNHTRRPRFRYGA